MQVEDKDLLKNYLTEDEPFGPIDAIDIDDHKALNYLFEKHNKIYNSLLKRPTIILGRKGSGKTSYLNSVYFSNQYDYIVEIESSDLITNVVNILSSAKNEPVFSEKISKIWENFLCIEVLKKIRCEIPKTYTSKKLIDDYLAKIGCRDETTIDDILWNITDIVSENGKGKLAGTISSILQSLSNTSFLNVKNTLISDLKKDKKKIVLLIDSLDDFQLHFNKIGYAIQGLLKFIGQANKPSSPIDIRLCLPSELYHKFSDFSSNPNKDFKKRVLLQWLASELVIVAAHRLHLYLEIHGKQNSDIYDSTKQGSQDFLELILPLKVTSKLGVDENPLAYILRHTQLLPRHLLILLNSIYQMNKRYNNGDTKFSDVAIRKGISAVEEILVKEIITAYKSVYPFAQDVCSNCIPELHNKFSIGDLERVFRRHGQKAMRTDDFDEFKKMLIEMGIIGKVLNEENRYIQAEFEYTVPHKLVSGTDDFLCFHPLFAGVYSAKTNGQKPVYPYGSRIEDKDYRL